MSSFQSSSGSECNILMAVFSSVGSWESARHLLAFNIFASGVIVWAATEYMMHTSVVQIKSNLMQYISDILHQATMPLVQGLPNIFQQDNARPHVDLPRYSGYLIVTMAFPISRFVIH
ncbi:hypothetical protein TNCV_4509111 [Trichonephila clavipes]|nr:hypothetical protein TNCV_4509111 [Trichonephila clavipes]